MIFNSVDFLFFFPVVVFLFFVTPFKYRWLLLLIASYFFYMYFKASYALLIIASTLIDYFAGLKMSNLETKAQRKPYLMLSITANLGMLFVFKYYNFFFDSVNEILQVAHMTYMVPMLDVVLPVGISFYTFQTMSYSLDVYKGTRKAETDFGIFALYVSYFPQLVAGPIERSTSLIPQLKNNVSFDYQRVTAGLILMAWGFFKKVVVADQIAPMVDYVWSQPDEFNGFSTLLGAFLFLQQIYCDFSGYSDIAIGAAQVLGVQLMVNFRRPFFGRSFSEQWSRWHISLISWFRDYVFLPLVRNKKIPWPWYYNVMIIYVLSGIWHGANWTFLIWGFLNALAVVLARAMPKTRKFLYKISGLSHFPKLDHVVQAMITFTLGSLFLVYFRSSSVGVAHSLFGNLFKGWGSDLHTIFTNSGDGRGHVLYLGYNIVEFSLTMFFLLILESMQFLQETKGSVRAILSRQHIVVRWSSYLIISVLIILFSFERQIPFIYFQF